MRARRDRARSKSAPAKTRRRSTSKAPAFRENSARLKALIAAATAAAPSRRPHPPDPPCYPLEMLEIAFAMTRARLERENPDAPARVIDRLLRAWGSDHVGAPYGDAVGRPVSPSRRSKILGQDD